MLHHNTRLHIVRKVWRCKKMLSFIDLCVGCTLGFKGLFSCGLPPHLAHVWRFLFRGPWLAWAVSTVLPLLASHRVRALVSLCLALIALPVPVGTLMVTLTAAPWNFPHEISTSTIFVYFLLHAWAKFTCVIKCCFDGNSCLSSVARGISRV